MSRNTVFSLPSLGVDVMSGQTKLPKETVRSASNVDLDRDGSFSRRAGRTLRIAGAGFHSLYRAAQKGWMLVAQNSTLYRMDPATYALTALHTLATDDPLSYCEYNGNVYFSSISSFGWIPSDATTSRNVGVPPPAEQPALSAASGSLHPGVYGVVITQVDDRGEEGPASAFATIDLPSGGGIRLTGLPSQLGWDVYVYITSADGDILRYAASFPAVFPTYVIADQAQGGECETQFLQPLLPGEIVRWHNGRLLTARNGVVSFSEALRPHLYDPAHDFIPFSGHISFMESVGDGVYVGDSRGVWYLAGEDPKDFKQKMVSSCRAVRHSSVMAPPEYFPKEVQSEVPVAVWLGASGYVVGAPGGVVTELHPERIKIPPGLTGRSVVLVRGGRKQVITPVNSTTAQAAGIAVDSDIL